MRLILLLEADFVRPPGNEGWWAPGPEPLRGVSDHDGGAPANFADQAARGSYFRPRVASVLYGDTKQPRRWHATVDYGLDGYAKEEETPAPVPGVALSGLEIVQFDVAGREGEDALLIVHLRLSSLVPSLSDAAHLRHGLDAWIAALFEPYATQRPQRRAKTIVFAALDSGVTPPPPFPHSEPPGWEIGNQWLWFLASANDFARFPPGDASHEEARAHTSLSSDWSVLVLRDGMAFVARRSAAGSDFVVDVAPWLVESLYCDALALSIMQNACLEGFAEALADLKDPRDPAKRLQLRTIEDDFARFRNQYWWQQLSAGSHAEPILTAHVRQLRSDLLFDQITAELAEYSRQAERDQLEESNALQGVTNAIIALVTVLAAVVAIPLAILQLDLLSSTARLVTVGVLLFVYAAIGEAHRAFLHHLIVEPILDYRKGD